LREVHSVRPVFDGPPDLPDPPGRWSAAISAPCDEP
jgi:hypothetical protein